MRTRSLQTDQDIIVVFRQFDWQTGTADVLRTVMFPEAEFDLTLRVTPEHSRLGKYKVNMLVYCDGGRAGTTEQDSTIYHSVAVEVAGYGEEQRKLFDGSWSMYAALASEEDGLIEKDAK